MLSETLLTERANLVVERKFRILIRFSYISYVVFNVYEYVNVKNNYSYNMIEYA